MSQNIGMEERLRLFEHFGRGFSKFLAGAPQASLVVGKGFWVNVTAIDGRGMNMALVSTAEVAIFEDACARVVAAGVETLFCLAGEGTAHKFGEGWNSSGTMPLMMLDLDDASIGPDARVREASGPHDAEIASKIFSDAFDDPKEVADACASCLHSADKVARIWILEDNGVAVSAVVSADVEDSTTIWAMSTTPQHARRGFGKALLGHVMFQAKQRGMVRGLLSATPAGKPLYDAIGWSTVETWAVYVNGKPH